MYRGRKLRIAPKADIPRVMRPGEKYADQVQALLDEIKPWKEGRNPIETQEFDERILPMAVPIGNAKVVWGIHRGHKAREPKLSPFADTVVPRKDVGFITVELKGPAYDPVLIRAYGGEYTPPLPWMASAGDADGGKLECLEYWRSHAYLLKDRSVIRSGTQTHTPPDWFAPLEKGSVYRTDEEWTLCDCICEPCLKRDHCKRRHTSCRW